MNEAIAALHPPRPSASRRRIRRSSTSIPTADFSSLSISDKPPKRLSSSLHASSTRQRKNNPRFTELLLEHGEKQLNDWAVVASCDSGSNGGRLQRTEGRLRLCSRSVVFEPRQGASSKGIVRVPFRYMSSCPLLVEGADMEMIFTVSTTRYFVMKANNAIGPYEQIQTPADFTFNFLHSSPSEVASIAKVLYDSEKKSTSVRFDSSVTDNSDSIPSAGAQSSVLQQILNPPTETPIDPNHFLHVHEHPLSSQIKCTIKQPLLEQVGMAMWTNCGIYFQQWNGTRGGKPHVFWSINDMVAIARRCDGLKDVGLEIYFAKREGCDSKAMYQSVLLAFESYEVRERIVRIIMSQRQEESLVCYTDRSFVESALQQWQAGQLDNFSYLLVLNSAAGRSFHDLSRYPVFPWVLSNYSEEDDDEMYSSPLDLNNANNYRNLSKPIGALNEERFAEFKKRYDGMVQQQKLGQEQGQKQHYYDSPFMYGTHYSSPGYVLFYLLRVMPEHMLCLQNGKFDVPDRLFHSMESTFQSILANPADVKELIPEFFDPDCFDFLINALGLQLGNLQSGERVNDVLLPSWAKSAKHFLRINRAALESDYCTQNLPKWIDLIFGVTSRGTCAKEARNLFHPICYLRPTDVDAMQSGDERKRVELQANEFGIVPDQLFCREHPQKNDSWESVEGVVIPEYRKF